MHSRKGEFLTGEDKENVVSVHVLEEYRDSTFIAPLILTSALDLVVFQLHALTVLPSRKNPATR
jgi:hypothetical protein